MLCFDAGAWEEACARITCEQVKRRNQSLGRMHNPQSFPCISKCTPPHRARSGIANKNYKNTAISSAFPFCEPYCHTLLHHARKCLRHRFAIKLCKLGLEAPSPSRSICQLFTNVDIKIIDADIHWTDSLARHMSSYSHWANEWHGRRALSVLDIKNTVEQLLIEEGLIKRCATCLDEEFSCCFPNRLWM